MLNYIYIFIYIYIYRHLRNHQTDSSVWWSHRRETQSHKKVMSYWLVQPIYIYIYIHTYIVGGKRQINYKFILTSLFCGCPLIRGSPCKDESIVSLFFSPITTHTHARTHTHTHTYIYIYIYIYICIHKCLFIYLYKYKAWAWLKFNGQSLQFLQCQLSPLPRGMFLTLCHPPAMEC